MILIFPKIFNFIKKLVNQILFLVNQFSTSAPLRIKYEYIALSRYINLINPRNPCELHNSKSVVDFRAKLDKFSDYDPDKNKSVKVILNLGLVAHKDITHSSLPGSPELVKKFQMENLQVAVCIFLRVQFEK